MSTIKFVNTDIEVILGDSIYQYEKKHGQRLNPADPERLMIDCMAYRELTMREQMNGAMRQNFVQLACDAALNMWGELFGCSRNTNESDDSYRERIMALNKGSLGTAAAYRARLLGVRDIVDVQLMRHYDDPTIAPGVVEFSALQESNNGVIKPDADHIRMMRDSVHEDSFGVLGVDMVYATPVAVPISGTITIVNEVLYNKDKVKADVLKKVKEYIDTLSKKFDSTCDILYLDELIKGIDGVFRITDIALYVDKLTKFQYYTMGTITIII